MDSRNPNERGARHVEEGEWKRKVEPVQDKKHSNALAVVVVVVAFVVSFCCALASFLS
jgi:hypothetical protein